jgi:tetratricopeptide (TPR) repeat protein
MMPLLNTTLVKQHPHNQAYFPNSSVTSKESVSIKSKIIHAITQKICVFAIILFFTELFVCCKSGLVTTSNSCYNLIKSSDDQNKAGDFNSALANFNEILKKCDAYDAKIPAYAGKSEALNGLHQYNDALAAAQEGLKLDKSSINNLFEKASAEMGLGMYEEAKADLQLVISLTEKNRNATQRATIYAKIAALDSRQKQWVDAQKNVQQAISLDPNNGDLYILQGDIFASSGNFPSALESYNRAINIQGNQSGPAWTAKVEAIIKMNQAKYGTSDANTLASKMNVSEKQNLCGAIKSGLAQGMKSMNIEMLQISVCK